MRPADHPGFFRFPAPEGASRESTLRLSADGEWFHEGDRVEHPALHKALSSWIGRHPDDGRYILTNGYDWVYVTIDDAPFLVTAVAIDEDSVQLTLNDGTAEAWDPTRSRIGANDALYALVKHDAAGGPYEARFTRHAQMALEGVLVPADGDGGVGVTLGGKTIAIGRR